MLLDLLAASPLVVEAFPLLAPPRLELALTASVGAFALAEPRTCPARMVHVRGVHHEHVQRVCKEKRWGKCVAFEPDLLLVEPAHTAIDVCIDRHEWPNRPGVEPDVMVTFGEAEERCASVGKRLCTEFEWELACEGPRTLPWPYGWQRAPGHCNGDRPYLGYNATKLESDDPSVRRREVARLWQGAPAGAHPRCVSAFGAEDLVGNVEEWVRTSRKEWPRPSALKGGYWSKPWTGCRGTNEQHGGSFRFYQVGFRCCQAPS
ncbi:MAG: SUMF1/EgtB/PvdO family nonheme iron enzyme [Deltaproteobacteria bacterium]|nr:SUMF1/EgtB/PvdO family nonheme iron enzyme [Deltaproteobacteria bacterium]